MTAAYQSQAQAAGISGGNAIVTKPAGTVSGDLLIAVGVTNATTITPPAGWTEHANSLGGQVPLWTRVAGGSEGATYTFSPSGGALQYTGVVIVRVNGVHATTPVDDARGVTAASGNLVIPSVTSSGADRLLMQVMAKAASSGSWTPPGTATERFDSNANTVQAAGGDEIVNAGGTGTRTWIPTDAGGSVAYGLAVAGIPPGAGTFTGSYDFTGTGFTGQAGPGQGSFTGGYSFAGTGFNGQTGPGQASFTGGYDFTGSLFVGSAGGGVGVFAGGYDFTGTGFTGVAPPPIPGSGDWTPGGRDRFTARRTPKNRRRSR